MMRRIIVTEYSLAGTHILIAIISPDRAGTLNRNSLGKFQSGAIGKINLAIHCAARMIELFEVKLRRYGSAKLDRSGDEVKVLNDVSR